MIGIIRKPGPPNNSDLDHVFFFFFFFSNADLKKTFQKFLQFVAWRVTVTM